MSKLDFATLSRIDEDLLSARLNAVRDSIEHAGEKGRALEHQVRALLRDILPAEYGLTTGFVAWLTPKGPEISSQLDVIIYDAVRYGPLIQLGVCDVLPLEAVYGYVEVKASLRFSSGGTTSVSDNSIDACLQKNAVLRQMRTRWFSAVMGSPLRVETFANNWLAVRAYIIAFEVSGAAGASPDTLAGRMADALKSQGRAHIHGVLVPHHGFFYTRPVDGSAQEDDHFHVKYTTDHPMLAFRSVLLQGLASFQRPPSVWAPALHKYFDSDPQWLEKAPSSFRQAIQIADNGV